ncbi:leucine-rich repeat-containing protein, partial [Trifolium pratense]
YGRQHLLRFMFKHGHYHDACYLFFPPDAVPPPPQPSNINGLSSSSPQRLDSLATDYGTIDDLCESCIGYGAMPILEEVISTRMSTTTSQDAGFNQYTVTALARICLYCETHKHFNYLYSFQVIKKDHVAAGLCCIQLFMNSSSQEEAIRHLEHAKMHFDEGLSARHKGGESTKLVTKGLRGKSASEKLSEEGLVKFSTRVSIQVEIIKAFNDSEGPQWKHSLFGNPNDPDTFRPNPNSKMVSEPIQDLLIHLLSGHCYQANQVTLQMSSPGRRCEIAEFLVEKFFDLAFQVIYEFNLPAVDIYAAVAASFADKKKSTELTTIFKHIKGTIDDDDWDQTHGCKLQSMYMGSTLTANNLMLKSVKMN